MLFHLLKNIYYMSLVGFKAYLYYLSILEISFFFFSFFWGALANGSFAWTKKQFPLEKSIWFPFACSRHPKRKRVIAAKTLG